MSRGQAQNSLVALSQWIDAHNVHRAPEAATWGRIAKIQEEAGEVISAMIAWTGQNPRKAKDELAYIELLDELLDVAVTALAAFEHVAGHSGQALVELERKILKVAARANLISTAGAYEDIRKETP